jgi:chemotaxis protein MotB
MAEAQAEPIEEPIPNEDAEAEEAAAAAGGDGGEEDPPEECPSCPPAGAPLWMATFADMMSLLLCFFVLILSFAEMNVPKYKQISGSLQSAFGIQRIVPVVEPPKAQSLIAKAFTPSVAQPTPIETIRQQTTDETQPDLEKKLETKTEDFPTPEEKAQLEQMLAEEIAKGQVEVRIEDQELIVEMKSPNVTGGREAGDSGRMAGAPISREALNTYAKIAEAQSQMDRDLTVLAPEPTVASSQSQGDASGGPAEGQNAGGQPGTGGDGKSADDLYARLRADLSEEIEEGLAEVERDGDAVIVRLADQGSFASGSADLQPAFLPLLRRTGQALTQGDGKISVNGHTDNVPILFNDRFNSNWDLSAARAAAVADFLLDEFPANPASMTISGFADSKPIADNGTPQGRAQNRRIEIIVEPS